MAVVSLAYCSSFRKSFSTIISYTHTHLSSDLQDLVLSLTEVFPAKFKMMD